MTRKARRSQLAKRFFDFTCACFALLTLIPLFIVIGLAIRLDSRGPVFFRQIRIGRGGRPFRIWKFRTMCQGADQTGAQVTIDGDQRVTRVGRLLRKTKLDELPQLINVVQGTMSLVGPRPEVPRYVQTYTRDQGKVLCFTPGITDPASIEYRHEEAELANAMDPELYYQMVVVPRKLAINIEYQTDATVWSDLLVILRTLVAILQRA